MLLIPTPHNEDGEPKLTILLYEVKFNGVGSLNIGFPQKDSACSTFEMILTQWCWQVLMRVNAHHLLPNFKVIFNNEGCIKNFLMMPEKWESGWRTISIYESDRYVITGRITGNCVSL